MDFLDDLFDWIEKHKTQLIFCVLNSLTALAIALYIFYLPKPPESMRLVDENNQTLAIAGPSNDNTNPTTILQPRPSEPELIMSIELVGTISPRKILGFKIDYPVYVYKVWYGNQKSTPTGQISFSVAFPEEFKAAGAQLGEREIVRKRDRLVFDIGETPAKTGGSVLVYVESKTKPDLANIVLSGVSKYGKFEHVSRAYFETKFSVSR